MSKAGKGVNRGQLAHILGVGVVTVDAWVQAGCPFEKQGGNGKPWIFNSAHVINWSLARIQERGQGRGSLDASQELARKNSETADALAMKNAELRAELVPAVDVAAAIADAFAHVRSVVSTLPTKIAAAVAAADTAEEAQQTIAVAVWQVLDDLAGTRVPAEEPHPTPPDAAQGLLDDQT